MSASSSAPLVQYAPAATSLFNNMKTPASILASAMVPLGLLNTLPVNEKHPDNKFTNILRKSYLLITVVSFFNELMAVMWATVAVNRLTETVVAPAESVWHLLNRDYSLSWAAVNTHFVLGMIGFVGIVGTRALFMLQLCETNKYLSTALSSSVGAAFALMIAIVNRGVEKGGSNEVRGFGRNIFGLLGNYAYLLRKQAFSGTRFGVLESLAVVLMQFAVVAGIWGLINEFRTHEKND